MEATRIFDVFYYQRDNYPNPTAINARVRKGWERFSTQESIEEMESIAKALLAYNIKKGDKIAIIASSSPLWIYLDMAIMMVGAIPIPIYPNITDHEYLYILQQSKAQMAFVGDNKLFNRVSKIAEGLDELKKILILSEENQEYNTFLSDGKTVPFSKVQTIMDTIDKHDLATISYTSGTGGNPKGVMLSHWNIVSNGIYAAQLIPVKPFHRSISMLPTCHIFERLVIVLCIYKGVSIHFIGLENIGGEMREVQPHFFSTVPRILEKVYEKILQAGNDQKGFSKKIFFWAHGLAEKYDTPAAKNPFYKLQMAIADALVFNKWRAATGGQLFGIVTGGAALQPKLARIFTAAGIPVKQGYGQTESSPVISVNGTEEGTYKIGTTGTVIQGCEVKIFEDGEICIRGENVMMGYYQEPKLTAEAIDENGWLHTGDIGVMDEGKFLKITDRKKELFKTSAGKYIAPAVIENKFKESFFIEQMMVVGENQKAISALIIPNFELLIPYAKQQNITYENVEDLIKHPEIIKYYTKLRNDFNVNFSDIEKVKKFILLSDRWSIDGGEITPTLKMRRKVILKKYEKEISELYKD